MNRDYDKPLVDYLVNVMKGFEILPNIKIVDWQWDPNEDNYNVNDHIVRRNSNKNKVIKNITETRCGVLYFDVEISGVDKNGETKVYYIKKPLIVPIKDKDGYYLIKGKKAYIIFQMVDKISYPSIGAVTVKSLMPISVKTSKYTIVSTDEQEFTVPVYTIQIFKNAINVLMMYSHLALSKMLNFLEVYKFIKVFEKGNYTPRDGYLYFESGKKTDEVVEVNKKAFDEFIYVRSIVGCLLKLFDETKIKYADLDNWDQWMIVVGGKNTIRRGIYQHIFFNRLLDDVTKAEIKINYHDKQNIYYLLRWILQNYHVLWSKDNLSMINKRLRDAEYMASPMTAEVSKRINRLNSLGDKATIKEYLSAWKFPEDIYITKLYGSGILRYSENNNAIDCSSKFTYTKKGPNSLGNQDTKRIPLRQRLLHPSMLGYIDVSSTSNSDPGQGGELSPWCQLNSFYFDDSLTENELHFKINKYLEKNPIGDNEQIVIKTDDEATYNRMLDAMTHFSEDNISICATSYNALDIIIEKDPRLSYRQFDESNVLDSRIDVKTSSQ
jgi:hypothetical protein